MLMKIRRSTLKGVLLIGGKVWLYLANKNKDEIILKFKKIYYLSSSLSNLINH